MSTWDRLCQIRFEFSILIPHNATIIIIIILNFTFLKIGIEPIESVKIWNNSKTDLEQNSKRFFFKI